MPANTNLPELSGRIGYVDLYAVDKTETKMPYKECVRKPLKQDCEYIGHAFSMQLYNDVLDGVFEYNHPVYPFKLHNVPNPEVMQVKYYKYKIGCRESGRYRYHYSVLESQERDRIVDRDEFAAGPFFALMLSTKPERILVQLKDLMEQDDLLYSDIDSLYKPSAAKLALHYFDIQKPLMNPRKVRLQFDAETALLPSGERRDRINSSYINVVHDCNHYCVLSSAGTTGHTPFSDVRQDGLLCAHSILEVSQSNICGIAYHLSQPPRGYDKYFKLAQEFKHPTALAQTQEEKKDSRSAYISEAELYAAIPQLAILHQQNTTKTVAISHDSDTGSTLAIAVVGCILPTLIGGAAVAYIVRSSSRFAQSIRTKITSITQTMRGMQQVDTQDSTQNSQEDPEA